ncbi:shikimate dehydrogenase family protein [Stakelama saccharophila]|uniref:Shikimate dehydrogenase (NADP(+)) n=1 Tax=Stakelama saccharophila TaxID=3075605 RepID=A0ABZ0BA66_9SPHN|nr:shikimate dehydrogenase [Stakelama sp. W311]WNO54001.1 shikimate dehydrogenase [Stakelama sp. W311]
MTQVYAEVIGDPIAHSKSPVIHNFWLKHLEIDAEYRAHHVRPEELAAYFAARRADPAWRGCNITLPHKQAALDHVGDPGGVRESIGAINLAARDERGDLFGTNTDAGGFFAPISGMDMAGAHVGLIGAGGAARAVLFALSRLEVGRVTIFNRTPLKAAGLLAQFGLKGDAVPLDAPVPPVDLLVNASALGMAGQAPLDIDLAPLPDEAIVYDIVYAPLETDLLSRAHARGLETVDGLEMLIGQAAIAFEILFDTAPPRDLDETLREKLTG